MPVLDTNFLIRLAARDAAPEAALRKIEDQDLVVPAQVAAEYLAGVAEPEEELARLHGGFRVVQTTDMHLLAVARLAARAFALLEGTYVATTNKRHFRQLGVEAWHYVDEAEPPT